MRIMLVAGHPADMFDHCGGTLCRHIQRGDSVTCVALTQGLRVHDEVIEDVFRHKINQYTPEEVQKIIEEREKIKYAEVLDACAIFGITDVRFLSYDDEILLPNNMTVITKLSKMIRDIRPDLLITHWPWELGINAEHHGITGQITCTAAGVAGSVNYEDRQPAWKGPRIIYMLSPWDVTDTSIHSHGHTVWCNYFVDVTDVIDLKVKACAAMRSQKYDLPNYAKKVAEIWNGSFGGRIRSPYAEGFYIPYPEVGDYLPDISPYKKWLNESDETEVLRNASNLAALSVEVQERE